MQDRLEQLLEFYKNDPSDPFIIYGLAIEYQKTDIDKAKTFFDLLLNNHPDYTPTYYHAGKFKEFQGNYEDAVMIYETGIKICEAQNEIHSLRELKSALQMLKDELE
jgi:tetratricopeptide (TPR) repeat protein